MKSNPLGLRTLLANHCVIATFLGVFAVAAILLTSTVGMIVKRQIPAEFLTRPVANGVLVLAFAYGAARGWFYHPAFHESYRKHLASTPWTPSHPLPKGPVHLVWTDLIVVSALGAIAGLLAVTFTAQVWPYAVGPSALFAVAVALFWTAANARVGQMSHVYAVLCVPILFGMLRVPLAGFLLCPFFMAGIAWHGVRRSLAMFPWRDREIRPLFITEPKRSNALVGWPYRTLLQPTDEFRTTAATACIESALVAGWVWLIVHLLAETDPPENQSAAMILVTIGAAFGAVRRLASYAPVTCARLCWGDRVANRKWIIPRHDQIFLAPLLMVGVGWALPFGLHYALGASIAVSCGVTAGIVMLIARRMGPGIQVLQSTGVHSKFGRLMQSRDFVTTRGSNA